jgi:hypothetical protein
VPIMAAGGEYNVPEATAPQAALFLSGMRKAPRLHVGALRVLCVDDDVDERGSLSFSDAPRSNYGSAWRI